MWRILRARLSQGHRTMAWPAEVPPLPDRFRGPPRIDPARCVDSCRACAEACPTDALSLGTDKRLDLGRCLFCGDCAAACPNGAVEFAPEHRLAARAREALIVDPTAPFEVAGAKLDAAIRKLFGRSLKLRQVSAAGCNGCESDTNVLNTIGFDLSRFGIQFVASPRHADGLLVTGCVGDNMRLALDKTWQATPSPKIVIAVGACAISGGPYLGHPEQHGGAASTVPVDLFIPGCPPHPLTILDGLLRMLGRIADDAPERLRPPATPAHANATRQGRDP